MPRDRKLEYTRRRVPAARAARSRFIAYVLTASFIVPIAILITLRGFDIPLGQGYFFLRYSPIQDLRIFRAAPLFVVVVLVSAALFALCRARFRIVGFICALIALTFTAVWMWWAPPNPMAQQSFNYRSLSHDGAFVIEAENVTTLPEYLRRFDEKRLTRSIKQLGGTRALSNPPGATIICYVVFQLFPSSPDSTSWLEQTLLHDYEVNPVDIPITANALRASAAFVILWAVSAVLAYFLGRLFLSPAGALLFAVIVTFNPCTVHFTPGKDSAQLLTINAMLWMWLLGWKRKSSIFPAISGAFLIIGATLGLIHFWIALAMIAATAWHDRKLPIKQLVCFIAGAVGFIALVYLAIGWNIPATLFAVTRRFAEVQKTFQMNHLVWFFIGLPLFLLFVAPGLWVFAAMDVRRLRMGFGMRLVICTMGVMLLTYAIGVTYELPRLWVAFMPLLTLGLMIDRSIVKNVGRVHAGAERSAAPDASRRAAVALILIAGVHILFTGYHWTILDARESEYRLISKRMFE